MSKRQTVTYAKLHQDFFIPGGIGILGNTLPPTNKTIGLSMYLSEYGLVLDIAKGLRTPSAKAVIPYANVAGMVYGAEVDGPNNT